ncbi:uncharacterized protein LOC108469917 isoform X2 [Gossypium arboreum]|uniref:uncharacterized protein LOC108469917 isoform X2 n=1 Tax=Gossypium arboreum TaxID=29729 RepID=UPI0022F14FF7|nr:uncharacterized protein LOC108469917 isoform X2 [Gossypium arboreum]
METKVPLASSIDGSLSLLKVGSERHFDDGITRIPDHVWPSTKADVESDETPPYVSRSAAATLHMPSRISSIRLFEKQSFSTNNDDSKFQCSLTVRKDMLATIILKSLNLRHMQGKYISRVDSNLSYKQNWMLYVYGTCVSV